ncbi:MAG: phospholipid carrier-dependent glycosyltransferase [Candidatus Sericytochromatia bacterium]|nr:phospholipid carrier-dependent glycosyltransferase [Candidatus Sericytochromatia bacterium]
MSTWHWPTTSLSRRDVTVAAMLTLVFATWASHRLALLPLPIFDEVLHVVAANEMLQGLPPSDVAHPPGCRWLIALGLALGPGPFDLPSQGWTAAHAWAWRLPSVAAAAATVGGTVLLGRGLGLPLWGSVAAAVLLGLDGVFFVHARIGMTNAFSTAFIVAATGWAWLALRRDQPAWLLPMGVALGAAVATRWTGVVALAALGLVALWLRQPWSGRQTRRPWEAWALAAAGGFAAVPALVYLAVCLPLAWPAGAAWGSPSAWGEAWRALADLHAGMITFHQFAVGIHPAHSPWWSWPTLQVPLWYYFAPDVRSHQVQGVLALGNPVLWVAAVPAWLIGLRRAWRSRQAAVAFVTLVGAFLWGAWALTGRTTTFSTYFGETLPFAALALVMALEGVRRARLVVTGLIVVAAGWTAWMLPLHVGEPLSVERYSQRMVLARWEFFAQLRSFRQTAGLESKEAFRQYMNSLGNRVWGLTSGPSPRPISPAPARRR